MQQISAGNWLEEQIREKEPHTHTHKHEAVIKFKKSTKNDNKQ